mgnify:CR=1 FL=1
MKGDLLKMKIFYNKAVSKIKCLQLIYILEVKDYEKNLTELVFILDKSGSMSGLEKDTVGGFNSMLKRQKESGGEVLVTTVLFNHETGNGS